jgi:hypothetical protein
MSDKTTPRVHLGLVGGPGGRPSRKRLDYLTRALVLKLRAVEPDRSLVSIAATVGISENSARRILQAHTTDAKGLTRELLVSGVLDRLDEWAKAARIASTKGYHQPAKDWLEAAEVVERKPAAPAVTVDARPTVVVNIPFALGAILPPAPPPVLPGDPHLRVIDAPPSD